MDTETKDDRETTEAVRSVEAAINQTINPNDTREAMKDAAVEAGRRKGPGGYHRGQRPDQHH